MKSKAIKKLHSQAGETIAETLLALLVSALAMVMLAGAISTAARLINRSETVMQAYYEGLNKLGTPNTAGISISLTDSDNAVVYFPGSDRVSASISVNYAMNDAFNNRPVIAYAE